MEIPRRWGQASARVETEAAFVVWQRRPMFSGDLLTTFGGVDVLQQPRAVVAALKDFAKDGPVHVGSTPRRRAR